MPDDKVANPAQTIADLQRELAQRTAERDEALARETATAEGLQFINSSPGDLTPVSPQFLATPPAWPSVSPSRPHLVRVAAALPG